MKFLLCFIFWKILLFFMIYFRTIFVLFSCHLGFLNKRPIYDYSCLKSIEYNKRPMSLIVIFYPLVTIILGAAIIGRFIKFCKIVFSYPEQTLLGSCFYCKLFHMWCSYQQYTVDSLISGHHWGKDYCPLIRGVRLLESL